MNYNFLSTSSLFTAQFSLIFHNPLMYGQSCIAVKGDQMECNYEIFACSNNKFFLIILPVFCKIWLHSIRDFDFLAIIFSITLAVYLRHPSLGFILKVSDLHIVASKYLSIYLQNTSLLFTLIRSLPFSYLFVNRIWSLQDDEDHSLFQCGLEEDPWVCYIPWLTSMAEFFTKSLF